MHFGEKVAAWLRRNAADGVQPSTHEALALRVREPQPKVSRAIRSGQPKLHVAHKIARVMGLSLDYLADADQPYPPQDSEAWDAFVSSLTLRQKQSIGGARAVSVIVRRCVRLGRGDSSDARGCCQPTLSAAATARCYAGPRKEDDR